MTEIYEISDNFVNQIAAMNPIAATTLGGTGYETELGDFSPEGGRG